MDTNLRDRVKAVWNAHADEYNQWDSLSDSEKAEAALKAACAARKAERSRREPPKQPPAVCTHIGGLLERIDSRYDYVKEKLAAHSISESGCWEWSGTKSSDGYGELSISCFGDKRKFRAHRISYAFFNGVDPKEKLVCHHCDNPACINPDHLFLGTHKDNMKDMRSKGREAPQDGSNNANSSLTTYQAIKVMRAIQDGKSNTEIANVFGVKHSTISKIRRGKSWSEVADKVGFVALLKFKRPAQRVSQ